MQGYSGADAEDRAIEEDRIRRDERAKIAEPTKEEMDARIRSFDNGSAFQRRDIDDPIVSSASERVLDREEDGKPNPIFDNVKVEDMSIRGRPLSDYSAGPYEFGGPDSPQVEKDAVGELAQLLADHATPEMVIEFTEDGEVHALKRDEFNLGFLGKEEIGRASTIDWDEASQSWGINLKQHYQFTDMQVSPSSGIKPWKVRCESLKYSECTGFDSYEEARDCEVRWIEHCQGANIDCMGDAGLAFLTTLRNRARIM